MTDETNVVLEIYKTMVEMADRSTARRAGANTFFLTLNTALAAVVGIVSSARRPTPGVSFDPFGLVMTSVAGIILAAVWWALLRYYRRLSAAKFDVINRLELRLPSRPYTDEWKVLHPDEAVAQGDHADGSRWGRWRRGVRHREATAVEQVVPFVFMAVYFALGLRVLIR